MQIWPVYFTSPPSVAVMLTMFFLSCPFGALPERRGSLLVLPWRRLRLRFISLILLLSSVFRPRWPRSSSGPPPEDMRLRLQRTPVTTIVFSHKLIVTLVNTLVKCLTVKYDDVPTLIALSIPLSLFFLLFLLPLIFSKALDLKPSFEIILRPPHIH